MIVSLATVARALEGLFGTSSPAAVRPVEDPPTSIDLTEAAQLAQVPSPAGNPVFGPGVGVRPYRTDARPTFQSLLPILKDSMSPLQDRIKAARDFSRALNALSAQDTETFRFAILELFSFLKEAHSRDEESIIRAFFSEKLSFKLIEDNLPECFTGQELGFFYDVARCLWEKYILPDMVAVDSAQEAPPHVPLYRNENDEHRFFYDRNESSREWLHGLCFCILNPVSPQSFRERRQWTLLNRCFKESDPSKGVDWSLLGMKAYVGSAGVGVSAFMVAAFFSYPPLIFVAAAGVFGAPIIGVASKVMGRINPRYVPCK